MRLNITSGECLNAILTDKYPNETFVPFNEAMIKGTFTAPLFSDAFVAERAAVHGVTADEYAENLSAFMEALRQIEKYDEAVLWFGEEPFCMANRKVAIEALDAYGYRGSVIVHTVDEQTGDILKRETI